MCFNGIELARRFDVLLGREASPRGRSRGCLPRRRARFLPAGRYGGGRRLDRDRVCASAPGREWAELLLRGGQDASGPARGANRPTGGRGRTPRNRARRGREDRGACVCYRRRNAESAARRPGPFESLGPGSPNLLPEAIVTRKSARVCDASGPNASRPPQCSWLLGSPAGGPLLRDSAGAYPRRQGS